MSDDITITFKIPAWKLRKWHIDVTPMRGLHAKTLADFIKELAEVRLHRHEARHLLKLIVAMYYEEIAKTLEQIEAELIASTGRQCVESSEEEARRSHAMHEWAHHYLHERNQPCEQYDLKVPRAGYLAMLANALKDASQEGRDERLKY